MPEDEQTRGRLQAVLAQDSRESLSARLCQAAPTIVGVDGAGVSLISDSQTRMMIAASHRWAEDLETLQLELGEGPCLRAVRTREMVLVPDVERSSDPALTMYTRRLVADTSVRAVFGFPLAVGSIAIGAMDLYRTDPGPLSGSSVAAAVMLADFLSLAILAEHAGALTEERELDWLSESPDRRATVHQATGVLIVQLDLSAEEAFARLRAYAFRTDRRLTDVAEGILAHEILLER